MQFDNSGEAKKISIKYEKEGIFVNKGLPMVKFRRVTVVA